MADASPPPKRTWEELLDECCVDRPKEAPSYRVVFCGDAGAGKRTLVGRVKESLGSGDKSNAQAQQRFRGGGIEYNYVEVRRSDGSLSHTLELVCVDTPLLLDVAIPTKKVASSSVVAFVCDVSQPHKSVDAIMTWRKLVNGRIDALMTPAVARDWCLTRLGQCSKNGKAFAADAPSPTQAGNTTTKETRTIDSICAIPCVVIGTKVDTLGSLPVSMVPLSKAHPDVSSLVFLRDCIRCAAIEVGGDLAFVGARTMSHGSDAFPRTMAGHFAALASAPQAYPSIDSVQGAIRFELEADTFVPAGLDTALVIPPQIALRGAELPIAAVFPPQTESTSADAAPSTRFESHQQLLAAALGQGSSPARRTGNNVAPDAAAKDDADAGVPEWDFLDSR